MDMAYEGDETRGLATLLGFNPVVLPNPQRLKPWKLNKMGSRERNHVERLFRRLKGFRRILTRLRQARCAFPLLRHLRSHLAGSLVVLAGPSRGAEGSIEDEQGGIKRKDAQPPTRQPGVDQKT